MTTSSLRFCGNVHPDDVGKTDGVRACVLGAGHPDDLDHVDPAGNRWGRRTSAVAAAAMAVHPVLGLPDFEERMAAARARSGWELGTPGWADLIIRAFADPASDASELAIQKAHT